MATKVRVKFFNFFCYFFHQFTHEIRGRPTQIRYLNNINGDNELVIGFDESEWNISINGKDVSRKFGQSLRHNGAWKESGT